MVSAVGKQRLRARFRDLRRKHGPALQQRLDRLTAADLADLLARRRPPLAVQGHVGLCWPVIDEPDLRPWLQGLSWPLALPAVAAGRLRYRPWQPGLPLEPDDCGVPAPPAAAPSLQHQEVALMLVPGLAVDRSGVRLGYGGGWYDRLRADPGWRRVPALVVLPAACVCEALPADPWDVPFDGWLDDDGCHWI